MFTQEIICSNDIRLIKPDVERDAKLAVKWFEGKDGVKTLRLLGNIVIDDFEPNLYDEKKKIQNFLDIEDQLNWMIEYEGLVVGSVWVDLVSKYEVKPPSVHIMIGDQSVRGNGIGTVAEKAVMNYLFGQGHESIHSRTLVENEIMMHIAIDKLGYKKDDDIYADENNLTWQNLIKKRDA